MESLDHTSGKARGGKHPSWLERFGWRGFSGSAIKFWAVITMLLDHMGAVILERGVLKTWDKQLMRQIVSTDFGRRLWYVDQVLRCVGRMAFPIFAFFLVEGFCHTRNRKTYGLRLFLFILFSEVIFDLAIFDTWFYPKYQNVFLTLLIGYLTLWGMERFQKKPWLVLLTELAGCVSASVLRADYGALGVMLIILLYQLRGKPSQLWAGAAFSALESMSTAFGTAALAYIPLAFYNGERGRRPGKYFFYWFYPVHLLCLYFIRCGLLEWR